MVGLRTMELGDSGEGSVESKAAADNNFVIAALCWEAPKRSGNISPHAILVPRCTGHQQATATSSHSSLALRGTVDGHWRAGHLEGPSVDSWYLPLRGYALLTPDKSDLCGDNLGAIFLSTCSSAQLPSLLEPVWFLPPQEQGFSSTFHPASYPLSFQQIPILLKKGSFGCLHQGS